MDFYNQMAQFYDDIFPTKQNQIDFVLHHATKNKHMLDLGCANGGLLAALQYNGYSGVGIDLNNVMIEIAKNKQIKNTKFLVMDMIDILKLRQSFALITCFGNTLVHIDDKVKIAKLLRNIYQTLNQDGYFLVQIINYDRIIRQNITKLPTINTPKVSMSRDYQLYSDHIIFQTTITTKDHSTTNTVPLYPIFKDDLIALIKDAGFKNIACYGDYNRDSFDYNHSMHCIVTCQK